MQWELSTVKIKPGQVGYNCDECRRRNWRGKIRGRDCVGRSISKDQFFQELERACRQYETEDLPILLRRIGKGVCIKSFPSTFLSTYLFNLVELCRDFKSFPCPGGLLDQPALFFQAYAIVTSELDRLQQQMESDAEIHSG